MKRSGFTLIEATLVLVIVALVMGGVLGGRELIYASKIRSTINQKSSYDTAVAAFREKYDCYPGDCTDVAKLGLAGHNGNGDGIIYTHGGWGNMGQLSFWRQLVGAGFIPSGPWVNNTALDGNGGALPGYSTPGCPICVLHDAGGYPGAGFFVSNLDALSSLNCGSTPFTTASQGVQPPNWPAFLLTTSSMAAWASGTVTVLDARNLDIKVDDGKPVSGEVVAVSFNYYSDGACSGNFENPAFNLDGGIFYLGNRSVYNVDNNPGQPVTDIVWRAKF